MDFEPLSIPAYILLGTTSLVLLLSNQWRLSLTALALQYVGVFVLTSVSWPWQMAAAKLVSGLMSALVLWIAQAGSGQPGIEQRTDIAVSVGSTSRSFSVIFFRIFTAGVVILVVYSSQSTVLDWIPSMQTNQALGSFLLIGLGLLHLGLTANPVRVILGLLTVLAGFEIVYASVEISLLVEGLLAAVTLGLALMGVYMLMTPFSGERE